MILNKNGIFLPQDDHTVAGESNKPDAEYEGDVIIDYIFKSFSKWLQNIRYFSIFENNIFKNLMLEKSNTES